MGPRKSFGCLLIAASTVIAVSAKAQSTSSEQQEQLKIPPRGQVDTFLPSQPAAKATEQPAQTQPTQTQQAAQPQQQDGAFCLSGGIVNGYRCGPGEAGDIAEGNTRYSIQLLHSGQALPALPPSLSVYHRTALGDQRNFVYLGAFTDRQQAYDTMQALVRSEGLDTQSWRPALVKIDKSQTVPAVSLVTMYQSMSFSHLAEPDPAAQREKNSTYWPLYYTVQMASFRHRQERQQYIERHPHIDFICRTRRNGLHVAYTGVYASRGEALETIERLADRGFYGYLLKLQHEDMYDCGDDKKVVIYSDPNTPWVGTQEDSDYPLSADDVPAAEATKLSNRRVSGLEQLAKTQLNDRSISMALIGQDTTSLAASNEPQLVAGSTLRSSSPEPEVSSPEPGVSSPEPEISSLESGVSSPEPEVSSPEPGVNSPEPRASSPEAQVGRPDAVASPEPVVAGSVAVAVAVPTEQAVVEGTATEESVAEVVETPSSESPLSDKAAGAEGVEPSGSAAPSDEHPDRLADAWLAGPQDVFYTIQMATFNGEIHALRFAGANRDLRPLCRVRDNGQHAVYTAKFKKYQPAKRYLIQRVRAVGLDGYVVKLRGTALPPCNL
ncbi:MAG: hypothetical protein OIF38_00380 [Cellvibrionaceae bacterium]|nr:hypothetical protein [Cellvibrionaceae bacterium]